MGFSAVGLGYTTTSINTLVYSPQGSKQAGAAGLILLSIVIVSVLASHLESSRVVLTKLPRPYGFFISALLRNHLTVVLSTRSPFKRNIPVHIEMAG